jgi:adenosylcobinamide amidohydrolase
LCKSQNLTPEKAACLFTATNMNHAVIKSAKHQGLEVIAVSTGGVETNAVRVGDPASYYETKGQFEMIDAGELSRQGTINTMVFINNELKPGALVATIAVSTEAKTAVMQELCVNSRYSQGLATGTGTDQIGIACRLGGDYRISSADKHSKLGELIGRTVKQSVQETLELHNEYTPQARGKLAVLVERCGMQVDELIAIISSQLPEKHKSVLTQNFEGINRDPLIVAGVAAVVHLWDKANYGILPQSCLTDVFCSYGAQIAAAVSGNYRRIHHYRNCLAREIVTTRDNAVIELITKSIAMGFGEKWED